MGRPPLGTKAMSGAERQRKFRNAQELALSQAQAEVAELRARCAALESERDEAVKHRDRLIQHVVEIRQEQAKAREASGVAKEVATLQRKLMRAKETIRLMKEEPQRVVFMTKAERRNVMSCLHPDRARDPEQQKRLEEAFKAFQNLPLCEIEDDD